MIKNVILDMGNVLLDYNPQAAMQMLGVEQDAQPIILQELFGGPEWVKRDLGLISVDELYEGTRQRMPGKFHTDLKKCCEEWDICMIPLKGAKEFCNLIKEKGYGIYVLSNAAESFYEYFTRQFDLDFFDGTVISADVHITKPDVRIYEHLLEKYNLNAEECLFVDDRADNVEGAVKAGMKAVQFMNDFDEIKKHLKS
ncbi:MAG: HAD family phosphatase [Clostridia bacterium]|nr:HAD family phosphatase [Clostridia bacterium]